MRMSRDRFTWHCVVWLAVGVMLYCGYSTARGQSATQPVVAPQVQQLRDVAAWAETVDRESREKTERVKELEAENERLEKLLAAAAPRYTPGMALEAGGFYRLPDEGVGATILIDKPGVTLLGGWAWPEGGPLFDVRAGGDNFTAIGVRIHHPGPPRDASGKRNIPATLWTRAKRATLLNCTVGTVGELVKEYPTAEGTAVIGNVSNGDVDDAAVGIWGGRNTVVAFNYLPNSNRENLVRASTQRVGAETAVPSGLVVAFNDLGNPGNKSVVNPRHIDGTVVFRNRLTADTDHAAVGVGDELVVLPDKPGSRNTYVIENEIVGGFLRVNAANKGVLLAGNHFTWATVGGNCPVSLNFDPGTLAGVVVMNNTADAPANKRPFIGFGGQRKSDPFIDQGNKWNPVPATQPAH